MKNLLLTLSLLLTILVWDSLVSGGPVPKGGPTTELTPALNSATKDKKRSTSSYAQDYEVPGNPAEGGEVPQDIQEPSGSGLAGKRIKIHVKITPDGPGGSGGDAGGGVGGGEGAPSDVLPPGGGSGSNLNELFDEMQKAHLDEMMKEMISGSQGQAPAGPEGGEPAPDSDAGEPID